MPEHEAQLVAVDVANACHHPLVEQRLGQRPLGIGGEVRGRDVGIPVRAEQVGAKVRDDVLVVGAMSRPIATPRPLPRCRASAAATASRTTTAAQAVRDRGTKDCQAGVASGLTFSP
jgi:hypothetical protein